MELNPLSSHYTSQSQPAEVQGVHDRETAGKSGSTTGARRDEVHLSHQAQLLERIETAAREAPDIRSEVVEHFRQRIAAGEYQTDADKIAGKLTEEMPNVLRR